MSRGSAVRRIWAAVATAVVVLAVWAAPAAASFPGTNGRIASVRDDGFTNRLMTMRPDGSDVREVLAGAIVEDPAWSPRGRWIAVRYAETFTSADDGIWVVRPSGRGLRFVTAGRSASWSPDGGRLVVETDARDGSLTLATVRRDGTGRRLLDVPGRQPAWSPAGGRIAFVLETPETQVDDVWLLRLRDGALRNVTENVVVEDPFDPDAAYRENASDPDWSPDGERLAFSQDDGPVSFCFDRFRLHTVAADGTGERTVEANLPRSFLARHPAWAPNGSGRIAYGSVVEEDELPECGAVFNAEVATVSPADVVTNLTNTVAEISDTMPAWRAVPR